MNVYLNKDLYYVSKTYILNNQLILMLKNNLLSHIYTNTNRNKAVIFLLTLKF